MNPSERIRAALQKSEATRQTAAPTLEPPADVETTLPLVGATDEERVSLPKSESPKSKDKPEPKREKVDKKALSEVAPKSQRAAGSKKGRILLIAGVLVVAAGVTLYFQRGLWSSIRNGPAAVAGARPLQVDLEMASAGLIRIVWKTDSAPLGQAREGRLVVTEGSQAPRTLPLTVEQLRSGHLDYPTSADRLDFRLEVVGPTGVATSESVRARLPKAAEQPAETTPAPAPITARDQPAPPKETKEKNTPKTEVAVEKAPEAPKPAPRAFTPPPQQSQQPVEEVRTVVLDLPTAVPNVAPVKPVSILPDKMPAIPAPNAPNQAKETAASRVPPPVGGNLQEPKLLKKVAPAYPPLARSLRIEGSVKFTASIRQDGKVQNLQLVSGHKMLVQAAIDAVKQWLYRPAMLNGRPVDATTQIDVRFTLNN